MPNLLYQRTRPSGGRPSGGRPNGSCHYVVVAIGLLVNVVALSGLVAGANGRPAHYVADPARPVCHAGLAPAETARFGHYVAPPKPAATSRFRSAHYVRSGNVVAGRRSAFSLPQRASRPRPTVTVLDAATGRPTPVRVRLTQNGRPVTTLPAEAVAVQYGLWDHADGFGFQPDSSFYVAGRFSLSLPPGTYALQLSKGPEYVAQTHTLTLKPGQVPGGRTFRLARWIDAARRGWYSTDGHVHIRRSPHDNPRLLTWTQAEDVRVAALLWMGDFWETYYPQYAHGPAGVYGRGGYWLVPGQEDPRTPELGHALGYGADRAVRFRDDYYAYDRVFDELHRRGGLAGYAHHAESFGGYRGLMLDGLRGKVDLLEILQYCVSPRPLRTQHYYHLLDLGFRVTATAGSDFPWCGQDHDHGPPEHSARIGNARFYVYTNGPLTYASWKAALAAGRTVVSSGPILEFTVTDAAGKTYRPGDSLSVRPGARLTLTARAFGHATQVPLDTLEIVGHGRVLGRAVRGSANRAQRNGGSGPEQSATQLALTLPLDSLRQGLWLAARCTAQPGLAAHTSPIYVVTGNGGFHNPATVQRYLTLSEQYLRELEAELARPGVARPGVARPPTDSTAPPPADRRAWYYRRALRSRLADTRRVMATLAQKLGVPTVEK